MWDGFYYTCCHGSCSMRYEALFCIVETLSIDASHCVCTKCSLKDKTGNIPYWCYYEEIPRRSRQCARPFLTALWVLESHVSFCCAVMLSCRSRLVEFWSVKDIMCSISVLKCLKMNRRSLYVLLNCVLKVSNNVYTQKNSEFYSFVRLLLQLPGDSQKVNLQTWFNL